MKRGRAWFAAGPVRTVRPILAEDFSLLVTLKEKRRMRLFTTATFTRAPRLVH